jgi:hypothetical protein
MLREVQDVRQIPGEQPRRWFASDYFDLIVWTGDGGRVSAFDLHYDLRRDERVFMWRAGSGGGSGGRLRHHAVDDGTRGGRMAMTPLVTHALDADPGPVADRFERESRRIDPRLAAHVLQILRAPLAPSPGGTPSGN